VVIAGDHQLAVLEDAAGAQLLPVGAWLAGYRIIGVQADRVTLEEGGGRQVTVRLGASVLAPSERPPRAEGRETRSAAADPSFARDKEQRQAMIAEETARDKARARGKGTFAPAPVETDPPPGK
jgi:hypothetical protein